MDYQTDEDIEDNSGKRRKANKDMWLRNKVKKARLHGTEHFDYKGVLISAKTTGDDCR